MEDKKFTKDLAEELGFEYKYETPSTDIDILKNNVMMMTIAAQGDAKVEEILNSKDCPVLFELMYKRVKAFDLTDRIAPTAILMAALYDIDRPGKAVIYLIELLDFAIRNNKKVDYNDVTVSIFPEAFFTDETCKNIIDKIHKPKLARNSGLY